jgi:autotransporter-associated beta strand protein
LGGRLEFAETGTATFSHAIDGGGALLKSGAGALSLNATYDHTLPTFVNAGLLLVDGTISRSTLLIQSGATVGGTGATRNVSIASGGALAPGHASGAGVLATGSVTLESGAALEVEIGGTAAGAYDSVHVTGSVALGGATLDLSLTGGFSPAPGARFTIIDNDGVDPVGGTFAGLAEGASVVLGSTRFHISYQGGAGNDVVLSVASPPTIGGLGGTTAATEQVGIPALPGLTLADPDSTTLASATVTVTGGSGGAEDRLAFTNTGSATFGNIAGVYTQGTGVLALTSAGASATVAQWQAALRAVTYTNPYDAPTPGVRTLGVVVNDGSQASDAATQQVTVSAVNDPPNIGGASGSLVALEQTPLVLLPSLTLSDPDSATLASVRVGFSVGRIVGEAAARCRGSWPTSATPSRGAPAPTISTATPATTGWTAAPGTTPPRAGGATTA